MSNPNGASTTIAASIGSCVVEHRLESGTSGDLSLARQPALERQVLLRRLRRELLSSERIADRFHREARFGARLIHPNVVQVFDCFDYGGDRYLMLEYVDGADLRSVLERAGPMPARVAIRAALELCRALREVHSRRLVHADLRPEHVQISRWGDVKLGGLGCARELGENGPLPEASPYTPPEFEQGETLSWGADTYAFGAILREMLTGEPLSSERPIPNRRLARLVQRCTDPDPRRRPAVRKIAAQLERLFGAASAPDSRSEIAAWLWESRIFRPTEEIERDERIRSAPDPVSLRRRLQRHVPALAGASAGAALALGLWWGWFQTPPPPTPTLAAVATRPPVPPTRTVSDVEGPIAKRPIRHAPVGPTPGTPASTDPAMLRVIAYPWAEVEVEGAGIFLTPRVEPIPLSPGVHRVIFRHPSYGEALENVSVASGEQAVIRHVFLGARRGRP